MSQQEINIASISGLLDALGNPNAMVRAATLQAIAQYPEKASSLAEKDNINLFSELGKLRDKPTETGIRTSYVHALLSLDDRQVPGMAKEEFLATDNTDIILLTASKLATLAAEERIAFLAPVIMAATSQTKSRAAANLLSNCLNLPVALAIRVAIISDHRVVSAPLNDNNLHAWLTELQGQYPRKTRKILLAKEDGSFLALLDHWEILPGPIKLWAFNEAIKLDPKEHASLICTVLRQEESSELLCAALAASESLARSENDDEMVAALTRHPDPHVRAMAIESCGLKLDLTSMLQHEPADQVRVAIIEQMGRSQQAENLALLGRMLEDSNWRIRVATTSAMVALAPDSIPLLQKLVLHHKPSVKAAAMQALQKSGQGSWLNTQLSTL